MKVIVFTLWVAMSLHTPSHTKEISSDTKFYEMLDSKDSQNSHDSRTKDTTEGPSLSAQEIEMIRTRILDGLGLVSIPTRNMTDISQEEFNEAYSEYLRAVHEEDQKNQNNSEDFREENPPNSSFRFYSNKVTAQPRGRNRRSVTEWQKIVHFQVSMPVPGNSSSVVQATARFWKKGSRNAKHSHTIPVSFYRLDHIPRGRFKQRNLSPVFLSTQNVSVGGNQWLDLDMKDSVTRWLQNPEDDTGILIRCADCAETGVKFMTGATGKHKNRVPRLDVQTRVLGLRRVKRSRKMRKSMRRRERHADCHEDGRGATGRSRKCCRRSMRVRFSELSQFDFIISPTEFDAFYCSGGCPARYNPANEHALLQAFVNLRGQKNIPGPCCAPTQLKGLPILHVGNDGRLKTNYWSDVIVTKCECT